MVGHIVLVLKKNNNQKTIMTEFKIVQVPWNTKNVLIFTLLLLKLNLRCCRDLARIGPVERNRASPQGAIMKKV